MQERDTDTDKECKDTSNGEDEQLEPGFPEGIVIADTMSMPLENKDGKEGMKLRRRSQIKVILKRVRMQVLYMLPIAILNHCFRLFTPTHDNDHDISEEVQIIRIWTGIQPKGEARKNPVSE